MDDQRLQDSEELVRYLFESVVFLQNESDRARRLIGLNQLAARCAWVLSNPMARQLVLQEYRLLKQEAHTLTAQRLLSNAIMAKMPKPTTPTEPEESQP